ncbi:MAG: ORF6N domain-containing protein [Planctomycetes bacterium]|nr:ORF6N domain-containing protein [Planctomycetota bacterium]
MKELIPVEVIERRIFLIRGQKVMLDKDLAVLYGVKPIRLREQVKRNTRRFPEDFMFQLNDQEIDIMVSQNAIPSRKHLGGSQPYVFTEQGVAMLATVLNSETAIQANIAIMRAFVKLREMLATHKEFAHKLEQLEKKIERHDEEISAIFEAIRLLMAEPEPKAKKIGFIAKERQAVYKAVRKR